MTRPRPPRRAPTGGAPTGRTPTGRTPLRRTLSSSALALALGVAILRDSLAPGNDADPCSHARQRAPGRTLGRPNLGIRIGLSPLLERPPLVRLAQAPTCRAAAGSWTFWTIHGPADVSLYAFRNPGTPHRPAPRGHAP